LDFLASADGSGIERGIINYRNKDKRNMSSEGDRFSFHDLKEY
jgi:hypothetical protein